MLRPFDSRHSFDRREEIKEVIELPIKHPEIFESLGISQPKAWKSPCYALRFVQLAAGLPGACCCMAPLALARRCSRELSPIIPTVATLLAVGVGAHTQTPTHTHTACVCTLEMV